MQELSSEALDRLSREVARLNKHRFIRVHNSYGHLIFFQFVRGLAFGFGSVLGATIVVSIVAWFISQIEFIPLIGGWATEILKQIDTGQ